MWLPYENAFQIAAVLLVVVVSLFRTQRRGLRIVASTAKELAAVMVLYGLWQYIRRLAITRTAGAIENAQSLWDLEQRLHLPSEVALQKVFLDNRPIMQFLNIYYGGMHVPAAGALLIWLFWRHRERYTAVRSTFVLTIAGCLTIQALVPMAPPRFLPELGFVDAGLKYGLSVYGKGGSGVSNELAAMPSLHVAWAVLVGVAVVAISTSRWRWLALAHPFLTIASITITANHWWLDGVVASMVLFVAWGAQRVVTDAVRRLIPLVRNVRSPQPFEGETPDLTPPALGDQPVGAGAEAVGAALSSSPVGP